MALPGAVATATSSPRIAVVGGGIAGTLCSLVLKNRGLTPVLIDAGSNGTGGRLRGTGCQFVRATDPRLMPVMDLLQTADVIRPWKGRFGLLGSRGGGFLPADVITTSVGTGSRGDGGGVLGLRPASSDTSDSSGLDEPSTFAASDGGDFCQFVHGSRSGITFAGATTMADVCPQIVQQAGIDSIPTTRVVGGSMNDSGWNLKLQKQQPKSIHRRQHTHDDDNHPPEAIIIDQQFDGLVIATHDPTLAASFVDSIVHAEIEAGPYDNLDEALTSSLKNATNDKSIVLLERLSSLSRHLVQVRQEGRQPLYALQVTYPHGTFSHRLPFDAVCIPGSPVMQFLAREASKPGTQHPAADNHGDVWTAISTTQLAKYVLSRDDLSEMDQNEHAKEMLMQELHQLAGPYFTDNKENDSDAASAVDRMPSATDIWVKRWGAALCGKGLELREDSITLASWRLGICGDFVRQSTAYSSPWEAAALSGLDAGERMASLFVSSQTPSQQ